MNNDFLAIGSGGYDLSIPLRFDGPQPNAYGVDAASSKPCAAGDLVGDTRLGGSCNFEQYTFIPHCNGTHTECVGHITRERISVRECLTDIFIRATLISLNPENAAASKETYSSEFGSGDALITCKSVERALGSVPHPSTNASHASALIIRTLPNDDSKTTRRYGGGIPPYFSTEAMRYIVDLGFRHLLVDLPSIDRLYDEGKLSNHRLFWGVEGGSFEVNAETRINSTVTELIYVPSRLEDGEYMLNLQIAPFAADASPSRPIIFSLR